jgi:hypothetical protein
MYELEGGAFRFKRLTSAGGGSPSAYQSLRAAIVGLVRTAPTEEPDGSLRESSNIGDNETYAAQLEEYHTARTLRAAILEADALADGEVTRG